MVPRERIPRPLPGGGIVLGGIPLRKQEEGGAVSEIRTGHAKPSVAGLGVVPLPSTTFHFELVGGLQGIYT